MMDERTPSTTLSPLLPPSTFLPPLGRLAVHSSGDLNKALQSLRDLYWPPTPPPLPPKFSLLKRKVATLIHDDSVPDSGYASAEEDIDMDEIEENVISSPSIGDHEALEILRSDPLERAFSITWITGFIARSDVWTCQPICQDEQNTRAEVLDEASSILSAFVGAEDDEQETFTRSFSFSTEHNSPPVEVELNDSMLDEDHTSVGLQSWGSAILLAEKMCASPTVFSLQPTYTTPLRVLELGAGTGLLSIAAAKILCDSCPLIIATDYHPDVLANLSANIATNFPPCDPLPVIAHTLDWEFPIYSGPLEQPFDVILAADVIYHPDHARWIKGCVEALLARPSATNPEGGVFWMIMALRTTGRHEGLDETVSAMFPDASEIGTKKGGEISLAVLERKEAGRLGDGIGRVDESGYKLFKIGWTGDKGI